MAAASSEWNETPGGPQYYRWRVADLRKEFPDMDGWDRHKILKTVRERRGGAAPGPTPPRRYECWMTTYLKSHAENELGLPHTREGYLEWIREHDADAEPEPEHDADAEPELPAGYAEAMETYDKWNHRELVTRAAASADKCFDAWAPLKSLAAALDTTLDELTEPIGAAYVLFQKKYDRLDAERKAALRSAAGASASDPDPLRACRGTGGRPIGPEDPPSEGFASWEAVADCLRIEREFDGKLADVADAKTALLGAFADSLYARALGRVEELAETILPEVEARTTPSAADAATAYLLWPDLSITMEKGGALFGTRTRFSCASPLFPSAVFGFEPAAMSLEDASTVRRMGVRWLREVLAEP